MTKLSDYIIMSDLDGTLIAKDGSIPLRNVEALRRFTDKGGKFAIATGRSVQWAADLAAKLPVNAPCILYNGGALYDFRTNSSLMNLFLPEQVKEYMEQITKDMPTGVVVVTSDDYYNVKDEMTTANLLLSRQARHVPETTWQQVPMPWYKVLFAITEDQFDPFLAYVNAHSFPGVRFVATCEVLIEMLPEQSSKGFALEQLIEKGDFKRENLVAIGDFYNDLEMIRLAGLGVTVEGAPADIKAAADLVVGSCENGALADLVEYLEARCD